MISNGWTPRHAGLRNIMSELGRMRHKTNYLKYPPYGHQTCRDISRYLHATQSCLNGGIELNHNIMRSHIRDNLSHMKYTKNESNSALISIVSTDVY